jgi:hypothetical protein
MTGSCSDDTFGPIVQGCRDGFDFTLLFEDAILSLVPSILMLLASAVRVVQLHARPVLVHGRSLQWSKQVRRTRRRSVSKANDVLASDISLRRVADLDARAAG